MNSREEGSWKAGSLLEEIRPENRTQSLDRWGKCGAGDMAQYSGQLSVPPQYGGSQSPRTPVTEI